MIYFVAVAVLLFLTVLLTPESDFVNKLGKTEHAVGTIIRAVGIVLVLGFVLYAFLSVKWKDSDGAAEFDETEKLMPTWAAILMLVVSAAGLFVGSNLLVENGQLLAQRIGVSDRVIGVTVIALGTSLPELVTTVTSAIKGQGDVGLGNIIGANLFNMLLVIGIPSAITGNIVFTAKSQFIDLPLALLVMVGLIVPMLLRKKGSRVHGAILVLAYLAYCVYSFVAAGA
jgi:cation:H+ antiporter